MHDDPKKSPLLAGLFAAGMMLTAAGCGSQEWEAVPPLSVKPAPGLPATSEAGEEISVGVVVEDSKGVPIEGMLVSFLVERGGGTVDPAEVTTGADGTAWTGWNLGPAPVPHGLRATILADTPDEASVVLELQGIVSTPGRPEKFGDVDGYMQEWKMSGSTEDLAFDGKGHVLMGVPGHILSMDPEGFITDVDLFGGDLVGPLGIAVDGQGDLWVADGGGKALRKVDPGGNVTTVLVTDGLKHLEGPNYVAIGPRGFVYLSDPCLGEIIRLDPTAEDPAKSLSLLKFDLSAQGGPNGMAFDAEGSLLYVLTENTGVLCSHPFVDPDAPLAGLYAIGIGTEGFGERNAVAEGIGLFGDGLAFDAEGNLYVVVDTKEPGSLALDASAVKVLPAGGDGKLRDFLVLDDPFEQGIIANVAFGLDLFGKTRLYMAMLAFPPFSPASSRGLVWADVGIAGQDLYY